MVEDKGGQGKLTLAMGSHMGHGGILHHGGRARTGHHIWVSGKGTLGSHGELLRVVHHLLLGLVGSKTRLHLRVLAGRGPVEGGPGSIRKAIAGRVHGL